MAVEWTTSKKAGQNQGVKALVFGRAGVGKTKLCATAPKPLIVSAENGLLSIKKYDIVVANVKTLDDVEEVLTQLDTTEARGQFRTICLDSISEIAEALLSELLGKVKDPRQAYGELSDVTIDLIRRFRDLKGFHVLVTAKESMVQTDDGVMRLTPSMPGKKLGPQLPYYFDEVFYYEVTTDPVTNKPLRRLRTQPDFQTDAKDRSGALSEFEKPNLTAIIEKIQRA
jgi:hypothetical protein